jgi:hypothetical protein
VRKDDLIKVQRDPGIRRKCHPAAQPWALGRTDIEPVTDEYAGLPIRMTKMLQRDWHFRKLRCSEKLVVRCQLRYLADILADILAELRYQPGRSLIDADSPLEYVS